MKRQLLFISVIAVSILLLSFTVIWQQNNPPVVKITSPKLNNFTWGSPISYNINVADKEDGDSRFEEVNGLEVLLEVKFVDGEGKLPAGKQTATDEPGLTIMRTSNCFNCHNFNGKLIGPSFNDIVVKYPFSNTNVTLLTKHIKEGSVGIWGKAAMPTHAELTTAEIETAVKWMYKIVADPNITYLTGLDGNFRTKAAPGNKNSKYIITASYTDHGLKSTPGKQRITGRDVMILQPR